MNYELVSTRVGAVAETLPGSWDTLMRQYVAYTSDGDRWQHSRIGMTIRAVNGSGWAVTLRPVGVAPASLSEEVVRELEAAKLDGAAKKIGEVG